MVPKAVTNLVPHPTPRRISMRQALWWPVALLLLLATGTLMVTAYLGTRALASRQADSLMAGVRREAEGRLHRVFDPIRQKVLEDFASIRIGRYSTDNPDALKDRLYPNLFSLQHVDSLMVGDLTGSQFLVMRYTEAVRTSPLLAKVAAMLPPAPPVASLQFFTRDFRPAEWGESSHWTLWDEVGRNPVRKWELPLPGYDGRRRPWHQAAMARFADLSLADARQTGVELIAWTDVYPLFTTGKPGISAAVAAHDPAGRVLIIAYDLLLDEIAHFSSTTLPTPNGCLFVLTDDDRLLGPPHDERPDAAALRAAAIIQPVASTNYPEVAATVAAWRRDHAREAGQFRLRLAGETMWAGFVPFEIGAGKLLWIGVLLPERDLVPAAAAFQQMILVVGALALLLAALAAALMARRLATPLAALATQAQRIAELDLAPTPEIRSSIAELANLSRTIAETRESLRLRIAERTEATEALRHSENRYRTLIEAALVGVVVHQDNVVRFANPAALAIFGYENGADFVDHARWDAFVDPAVREELATRCAAAFRGELPPLHPGWQLLRRDGTRRWVQSSVTVIEWDGHPALLAFLRDITALRTATERQTELEEQLRHAQKLEAVGLLAGGIAHDFNNLLQVIGGNAQFAAESGIPDTERRSCLEEILRTVQRASEMTRRLLAFGRRQTLHREPTELNAFVADHVKMVRRLIPENIALTFIPAPVPLVLNADRGQLEQVLLNLCVNARDAMPTGGRLALRLESATLDAPAAASLGLQAGAPLARLTVADTGHGMDKATLAKIFDPFFTTKPRDKGSGLGLAVVYGVVRQHEGHIAVASEPGQGATFVIHLPCAASATECAPPPGRSSEAISRPGGTILLAEDNEPIRRVARAALEHAGYDVRAVADGQEAVETFQHSPDAFDVLFFDVMMPRLGGFDAARRCRKIRADIPVVLASGYAAESLDEGEALPEGAQQLQKPYQTDTLLRLIARLRTEHRR